MMVVVRVSMDEGVVEYLQMLRYEADGLRVLNCQVVQSGGATGSAYDRLLERYRRAVKTYQTAFSEAVREAVPDYLGPEYQHDISFLTGELVVSRKEWAE